LSLVALANAMKVPVRCGQKNVKAMDPQTHDYKVDVIVVSDLVSDSGDPHCSEDDEAASEERTDSTVHGILI
jgi:hypothetical protein